MRKIKRNRDKAQMANRLKRIEGQVRGISRMVDEDVYCVDILVQIAAVRAALGKVGLMLLEDHTKGCVAQALTNEDTQDQAVDELIDIVSKFIK